MGLGKVTLGLRKIASAADSATAATKRTSTALDELRAKYEAAKAAGVKEDELQRMRDQIAAMVAALSDPKALGGGDDFGFDDKGTDPKSTSADTPAAPKRLGLWAGLRAIETQAKKTKEAVEEIQRISSGSPADSGLRRLAKAGDEGGAAYGSDDWFLWLISSYFMAIQVDRSDPGLAQMERLWHAFGGTWWINNQPELKRFGTSLSQIGNSLLLFFRRSGARMSRRPGDARTLSSLLDEISKTGKL